METWVLSHAGLEKNIVSHVQFIDLCYWAVIFIIRRDGIDSPPVFHVLYMGKRCASITKE